MSLREIRQSRHLTQRELSENSGVNYRSLQDYEQGHKSMRSANGDVLLRLSTVLGCAPEELLFESDYHGAQLLESNSLSADQISMQKFYCEKYRTAGRWLCVGDQVAILFYYGGEQYLIPFRAIFSEACLLALKASAVLQMEAKIEEIERNRCGFEGW